MDIDVYCGIGLLMPIAGLAYAIMQKPKAVAWILIVPGLLFLFIGAVSNSGIAPIDGRWSNANNSRYLFGSLITIAAFILLAVACKVNKTMDMPDKPNPGDKQ